MSYQFEFRNYFSIQHLKSAALFCKLSYQLEKMYAEKFSEISPEEKMKYINENNAFVTGTIFTCVSFLEAIINEFYCDAADKSHNDRLHPLSKDAITEIRTHWLNPKLKLERKEMPDKYQKALEYASKEKFDRGKEPYQSVYLLNKLRNELIHYKTESIRSSSFEPDKKHYFEKRLDNKFEKNLFFKYSGNPYFPDKCLGYGCARWALQSVIKFADLFYSKIGIEPPYKHVIENLYLDDLLDIDDGELRKKHRPNVPRISNHREIITATPFEIKIELIHVDDLDKS